jgi:octaprenyl-diphosphate synthase
MDATRADAIAWSDRAKAAILELAAGALRDMLYDLADYVVARIN